jgi:hypothetical protein
MHKPPSCGFFIWGDLMYRWIGPDGWMVQGVKYKKGDQLARDVRQERIDSFLQRGFIEVIKPEARWQYEKPDLAIIDNSDSGA